MLLEIIYHIKTVHEAFAPLIPLSIAAIEFINSEREKAKAREGLDAIGDKGLHTVSPELQNAYNNAQDLAKFGYTPEQRANFEQGVARSENTAYQRGVDRAPGLSQQILSGLNYSNIGAQNQFAASDAEKQLQHIMYAANLAKSIQWQKNLRTNDYINQEKAYGRGIAQQNQNEFSALNQAGYYGTKLIPDGTGNKPPFDPYALSKKYSQENTDYINKGFSNSIINDNSGTYYG